MWSSISITGSTFKTSVGVTGSTVGTSTGVNGSKWTPPCCHVQNYWQCHWTRKTLWWNIRQYVKVTIYIWLQMITDLIYALFVSSHFESVTPVEVHNVEPVTPIKVRHVVPVTPFWPIFTILTHFHHSDPFSPTHFHHSDPFSPCWLFHHFDPYSPFRPIFTLLTQT